MFPRKQESTGGIPTRAVRAAHAAQRSKRLLGATAYSAALRARLGRILITQRLVGSDVTSL